MDRRRRHDRRACGAALAVVSAMVGITGCAGRSSGTEAPETKEIFIVDDNPTPTDIHDLALLRLRATMGLHAELRALVGPRLAEAVSDAPDPGRDALRRLLVEVAIQEGDAATAAAELTILERDVRRLGPAAGAEEEAIVALLYSGLAYRANYFLDARKWSLQAIALLGGGSSPLLGEALTRLARSELALNHRHEAFEVLSRAEAAVDADNDAGHHEVRLLKVDILLALRMADEAIIAAGDAYDGAIERFGGDTLPHAEALLAVAAATYAGGSSAAARSMLDDAKEIFWGVQTSQPPSQFPVSERLVRRLGQLAELLPREESEAAADNTDAPVEVPGPQ